jgi:hypothetical protein
MIIEQRLAEIIRSFCAGALSSTVNLNVDLDIMLAVVAQALLAAFAPAAGYAIATPGTIQRPFLETPGQILTTAYGSPGPLAYRLQRLAMAGSDVSASTGCDRLPGFAQRVFQRHVPAERVAEHRPSFVALLLTARPRRRSGSRRSSTRSAA